jgi:hypothetical protein
MYFTPVSTEVDSNLIGLTNVIRKVTSKVRGFIVTSGLLRQIRIGIIETQMHEMSQPFDRFDDQGKNAHRPLRLRKVA